MTEPSGPPPATPAAPDDGAGPGARPAASADGVAEIDVRAAAPTGDVSDDVSGGVSAAPRAVSPWRDVVLTPFRGGTLLGFLALTVIAALVSWLEGGTGPDDRMQRRLGQAFLGVVGVAVMSVYARRIILCMLEGDRPVPWFGDARDETTTWMHDVGSFAAVLITSLFPALILSVIAQAAGASGWLAGVIAFVGLLAGALHLPFAALGVVLRNGPLGAGWLRTRRAWKANAFAARTAVLPALAFLGLVVVAAILGGVLVESPNEEGRTKFVDHTTGRDLARGLVFLVRFAAVWAGLSTLRVAGLLARDVPEIREVLA